MNLVIRVLIIDDSEDDALILADELRKNGCDSVWTRIDTPEEMEEALREQSWDVIIADYTMPDFSGPEALRVLQGTGLDIPFILVSGTASENTCVDVMRSGAQDLILKHDLSRLAPAVRRELAEAEIRRKRRQAEENVTRLAAIVEYSEDAIISKTLDGIITTWNHGAEKMFGYAADEVLGQPIEIIVPPERLDESMMLLETVRRGEAIRRFETERLSKVGDRLHVAMSVSPIKDRDGVIVGASTIARDMTELRLAQQREEEMEAHKRDFYRRTILAATDGKLFICEKDEIESGAGSTLGVWTLASKEELAAMRDAVSRIAREKGIDDSRLPELLGCVAEAAANAIKHANGGRASLHWNDDNLMFIVSDSGPGIGDLALSDVALVKGYSTAGTMGMGYKIMIEYADKVYLATGPEGTTVGIVTGLHPQPSDRDAILQKLPGWE